MPIQKLEPPTLNEINHGIAHFEERFHISTEEFLLSEETVPQLTEDDAVEWLYLVEQRRALQDAATINPYSRSVSGKALKNRHSILDRLAA